MMKRRADAPNIVVLPPVLVAGTLLLGLVAHYWVWTVALLPPSVARVVGLVVFVCAGTLAHFAHLAMQRVGTNVLPTQPTLALATDGPFRITRNPLYVAAIGVYVGVMLWVNSLALLILLVPMFAVLHWGIVRREEHYLEEKFGASYLAYKRLVPRWF